MKLFHKERGKEVVYVQMQDIMYLMHELDIGIPASIVSKLFGGGTVIVTDENRFEFVKFSNEKEVKYFKDLDFILDYREYKDLTDEQLDKKWRELADKLNGIAEKWNGMSIDERKKNAELYTEYQKIDYMLKFLKEVYDVKHGARVMPFPNFIK